MTVALIAAALLCFGFGCISVAFGMIASMRERLCHAERRIEYAIGQRMNQPPKVDHPNCIARHQPIDIVKVLVEEEMPHNEIKFRDETSGDEVTLKNVGDHKKGHCKCGEYHYGEEHLPALKRMHEAFHRFCRPKPKQFAMKRYCANCNRWSNAIERDCGCQFWDCRGCIAHAYHYCKAHAQKQ